MTSSTTATRLMVPNFAQACTVKAERRFRLLEAASVISVCEGVCLTRRTKLLQEGMPARLDNPLTSSSD